jgi:hypothetical protein
MFRRLRRYFNPADSDYILLHLTIFTLLLHARETFLRANKSSDNQQIPRILWNPKVPYRIHKSSPRPSPEPDRARSCDTSNFSKIYFNIILPSTPGCFKLSSSLRFPHQNPLCTSPVPHTCYIPCSSLTIFISTMTLNAPNETQLCGDFQYTLCPPTNKIRMRS